MEYKGKKGKVVMMGTRQRVSGWSGELCVVVVQYGDKNEEKFDVIPDSSDAADQDKLPEVKTFDAREEALHYALQMDRNKRDW
jgi:hypothetical protein